MTYKTRFFRLVLPALGCGLALLQSVEAVINPTLQPADLYRRHVRVVAGRMGAVDATAGAIELRIGETLKGERRSAEEIVVLQAGEEMRAEFQARMEKGGIAEGLPFAAFVGGASRRTARNFMLYADGFFLGQMEDAARWNWTAADQRMEADDGRAVTTLAGTWNGATERLVELLRDIARERAYLPRRGYVKFQPDRLLDALDTQIPRGIALYDLDGDGRLDIYVAAERGSRIYLQTEPMAFTRVERAWRHSARGRSVSVADVNLDGRPDILLDGRIFAQVLTSQGVVLAATDWLPADAHAHVKASAFVDHDRDGRPDVLISYSTDEGGPGGLRAFINRGADADGQQRPFVEITRAIGLHAVAPGADGFFSIGDWNGDGRPAIWYGVGDGILLLPDENGGYAPVEHDLRINFRTSGGEVGRSAAAFVPVFDVAREDLIVPVEAHWHIVANREGRPTDVTRYGGEISEGSFFHLATIAADFTMDGRKDLFTVSYRAGGVNKLLVNRGYGLFMDPQFYEFYGAIFEGPALTSGGWGVAAGDLNGDGAPDLVIGNMDGSLRILINDTLNQRTPVEHPLEDVRVLLETRGFTVRVQGPKGVAGAQVSVRDREGEWVARDWVARPAGAGYWTPSEVYLSVRPPHRLPFTVSVAYSDGRVVEERIERLDNDRPTITIRRGGD